MNDNKFITYYGEYSLYHWLEMILSGEITLPNFQRSFVWDPKKLINLIDSFNKGLYVPPILIANFSGDNIDTAANYVLDGQQRLSAILLAYLGIFPVRFKKIDIEEENIEDEFSEVRKNVKPIAITWDFRTLHELYNSSKKNISIFKEAISKSNDYMPIDLKLAKKYNDTNEEDINLFKTLKIDEDFLKNKFLGYSYIKAIKPDSHQEKLLFASIFKNINTKSVQLTHNESRSALYWISTEKRDFFNTSSQCQKIIINKKYIDFAKYMALLSNTYKLIKQHNYSDIYNEIAIGFARKRRFEDYVTSYVEAVINDNDSETFGKFSDIFPDYKSDFSKLDKYFKNGFTKRYNNNVEAEIILFGIFYWVLFEKRDIKIDEKLFRNLKEFENYHKDYFKNKNLNRLGAIRERIKNSIAIYKKYLEPNNDN